MSQEKSSERYLLEAAVSEIRTLRKKNEVMAARLNMFDSIMMLVNMEPRHGLDCLQPDLTYEIENFLYKSESEKSDKV